MSSLERDLVARVRGLFAECVYCGRRCYGQACPAHRDLIQLDPLMKQSRPHLVTGTRDRLRTEGE